MKQEGTRDLGHLDNMRPHNLLFTAYPNPLPLHTNNLLHYFKYFIPQALSLFPSCTVFFFFLCDVSSQFYQIFCLCLSFSLPNTPSFFLPSSGPLILSHLHVFAAWLSCPMFLPQPHIVSHKQRDEEGGGERNRENRKSGLIRRRLRKHVE